MYAVTSMPLDRRTRATLRSAEFGFLGVIVLTCRHTPFFCGQPCMAGCFGLLCCGSRAFFTNWLIVGIGSSRITKRPSGIVYIIGPLAAWQPAKPQAAHITRLLRPPLGRRLP